MGTKVSKFLGVPLLALLFLVSAALSGAFAGDGVVNTSVKDFRVNLDRTVTDTSKAVNVVVELLDEQGRVDVFSEAGVDYVYVSVGSIIGNIIENNDPDETGDDAGEFAGEFEAETAKVAVSNGRAGFHITYDRPGTDTLRFYVVVVDTDGDTLTLGPKEYTITVNQAPNQADALRLISMTPDDTTNADNKAIDYTTDGDANDDVSGQIDAGEAFTLQVKALKGVDYTVYQNGPITVKFVPVNVADSDENNAYSSDCANVVTVNGTMENGIAFIHVPAGTLTKAGKYAIYLGAESIYGPINQDTVKHLYVDALGPAKVAASLDRDYINDSNIVSPTLTVKLLDQYGNLADTDAVTSNVEVTVSATNGVLLSGDDSTTVTIASGSNKATFNDFSVGTAENAPKVDDTTGKGSSTISISSADYEVVTPELTLTIYEKKLVAGYVAAPQTYTAGMVKSGAIRVGVADDGNSVFTTASVFSITQDTTDDFDVDKFEIGNDGTSLNANPIQWDNSGVCQTENTANTAYWTVRVTDGSTSGIKVDLLDENNNVVAEQDDQTEGTDIVLSYDCDGVTGYVTVNIPAGTHTAGNTELAKVNVKTALKTKQVRVELWDPDYSATEPVDSVTSMVGVDGLVALKFNKAVTGNGDEYFKVSYVSSGYQYQPTEMDDTNITVNPADAYAMKLYLKESGDYDVCAGVGTPTQEISSVGGILNEDGEFPLTIYGSESAGPGQLFVQIEDAYGNEITSGTIYWESDSDPLNPTPASGSFAVDSNSGPIIYNEAGNDTLTFSTDIPGVQPVSLEVTVYEPVKLASVEVIPATEYVLTNGEIPVIVRAKDQNGNLIGWDDTDFVLLVSAPDYVTIKDTNRSDIIANGDNLPGDDDGERVLSLQASNTEGDVTITVRNVSGTIQGSATVHIVSSVNDIPAPVASVTFNPASVSVAPGEAVDVQLKVEDEAGNGLAGKVCLLETDAETVAEPTSTSVTTGTNGMATVTINAHLEGTAHITATCEGVSATLTVTVSEAGAGGAETPPSGEPQVGMADPQTNAHMPLTDGQVNVNFNYSAPVYIFAGMFSCDFNQVKWLNCSGGTCTFGDEIPTTPVTTWQAEGVALPYEAGYVFWMVVNTDDLNTYDWQSNYLLQFYTVGTCE